MDVSHCVAVGLLGLEMFTGLVYNHHRVPNYFGWHRFTDAIAWTCILWWGGFWN